MRLLISLLIVLTGPVTHAQQYKVGDKVTAVAEIALLVDGKEADSTFPGLILIIAEVKGDLIQVNVKAANLDIPTHGWLPLKNVIPLDQAAAHFTKAIDKEPDNPVWHCARATLLRETGELDAAIAGYTQALRLDPKSSRLYFNRGIARRFKHDLDGAIADYSESLRLDPTNDHAYSNRGVARCRKQDYDGAMADFNEAIRLNPKCAWTYSNRGDARRYVKDYDGAMIDFNEAIRLDPTIAVAYFNRSNVRRDKHDNEGATKDLNEAIRLDPTFGMSYYSRGQVRWTKNDYEGAINDFERSIRFDPQHANGYWELGWLLASCPDTKHRNRAMAVDNLKKAVSILGEKNEVLLAQLAFACAQNRNLDEAIEWQAKALELAPEKDKAQYRTTLELYKKSYRYAE